MPKEGLPPERKINCRLHSPRKPWKKKTSTLATEANPVGTAEAVVTDTVNTATDSHADKNMERERKRAEKRAAREKEKAARRAARDKT